MPEKTRDVEDFAIELADEFQKRCPPKLLADERTIDLAKAVDEICNRAAEFQRVRRLWLFGKAKLGTAFKIKLKEAGYPGEFVDELTRKLLINMSGK
jgi:hypothetical protein